MGKYKGSAVHQINPEKNRVLCGWSDKNGPYPELKPESKSQLHKPVNASKKDSKNHKIVG